MAFQPLQRKLNQRLRTLRGEAEKAQGAEYVLAVFVQEVLKSTLDQTIRTVKYDYKNNILTVVSANKTIANELSLRLPELLYFFKEAEINIKTVVIK